MGIFNRFPYSSTHEMNLDFMLGKAQEINEQLQTVQTGMQEVQTGLSQIDEQTERATTAAAAAEAARDESQQNERDAYAWTEQAEQHADRAEAALSQLSDEVDRAEAAADRAEAAADAASISASAASNSANIASQNAATAAQQAANATSAAQSAQGALNQATVAANNAQTSAVSAADAAALASGYNSQAATSATNAATSATNAASAAENVIGIEQRVQNLVNGLPTDFTELTTDVNELQNTIRNIPPTNIDGISIKDGTNILPLADVFQDEYISGSVGNALSHATSNSYTTFRIKAKPATYYFSNQVRFARATDNSDIIQIAHDNVTYFTCTSDNTYLYLSVADDRIENFMVGIGTTPTETQYIFPELYDNGKLISDRIYSKAYVTISNNLAAGESLVLDGYTTNIKKNNVYSFTGDIVSFTSLLIGHGKTVYDAAYLEITPTKAIIHRYSTSDVTDEYTHGLTIQNYIKVQIIVKNGTVDILIISGGNSYTISDCPWTGDGNAAVFAESVNSVINNAILTWSSGDFRKPIWMYGDSYFSFTNENRWTYYLAQNKYIDNVLLNAFPGEPTTYAWRAFRDSLKLGKPQFVVWCMGMNDGSDTDANTPSSNWLLGYNTVINYCNSYNIEPVFATIPTVPSINNEGKNNHIRNSGYRYIDFAKAVGADTSGNWYTGMLSNDGVHPTALGAMALYCQAIADMPEITFTNP